MTSHQTDTLLLKLAVAKGLVDKTVAKEVFAQARSEGRSPEAILVERGLLTTHSIDVLRQDAVKASAPKEIGGYRLGAKLGQGGMGAVYRATQISMDREVALKLIRPGSTGGQVAADRFLREARAAGKVNHPHVISVYDVGQVGNTLYLSMELVTGGDAEQAAKAAGGRLPEQRALEIIRDAARGLMALEAVGLIHRDIKPANIFLSQEGTAKLADLGLARSSEGDDRMTQTGATMGTPAYMSPEQADGAEDIDIRTDIYALGATLFALICGHPPYRGNSPWAVVAAVIRDPFPDPQQAGCSSAVAAIIRTACSKQREDRYQTAGALLAVLEAALQGGPSPVMAPALVGPAVAQSCKETLGATPTVVTGRTPAAAYRSRSRSPNRAAAQQWPRWLVPAIGGTVGILALVITMLVMGSGGDHPVAQTVESVQTQMVSADSGSEESLAEVEPVRQEAVAVELEAAAVELSENLRAHSQERSTEGGLAVVDSGSIRTAHLAPGTDVYSNRAGRGWRSIPEYLLGQTITQAGLGRGGGWSFNVVTAGPIYVAVHRHPTPQIMSDLGWEDTGDKMFSVTRAEYIVYRKRFDAGNAEIPNGHIMAIFTQAPSLQATESAVQSSARVAETSTSAADDSSSDANDDH